MQLLAGSELPELPRRERERLYRRRAMLRAALTVFAEKGYDQATVEEVAQYAEFGKGTLYNYFPGGKEAILEALLDEMFGDVGLLVREHFARSAMSGAPTREVFRELVHRLIIHFSDNRETFLLLTKEAQRLMLGNDEPFVRRLIQHRNGLIAEMEPAISEAVDAGYLKPYPPKAIAHMLLGNVQGYLTYALSAQNCADLDEKVWPPRETAAEFIADVLFDGLLTNARS